jgi:hypothetical protein
MARVHISNMNDDFLKSVQKKFKGRYYSKTKKWTFPVENETAIKEEWMHFIENKKTFDKETQTEQFYVHDIPLVYKEYFQKYLG